MEDLSIHPAWKNAVAVFIGEDFPFGHILTHEWLYTQFGLEKPLANTPHVLAQAAQLKFMSEFESFRKTLLVDHQVDLFPVRGVGYVIVEPADQTRLAVQDGMSDVRKALRRTMRRVVNTKVEQLTAEQQKANADAIAKLATLSTAVRRTRFGRLLLTGKKED